MIWPILLVPILAWLIVLSYFLYKTIHHYQKLLRGTKPENLQKILESVLDELSLNNKKIDHLTQKIQEEIDLGKFHVQKVNVLRYNPFEDTGGDQSFVLAILDGTDSGIVLTSLHSRGATRWYAKNVRNGKGADHQLSIEEEKAIRQEKTLK